MVSKILKFGKQKGSSLSLPAHGRAGARATSSLAVHFAKRNTKFGGGGKALLRLSASDGQARVYSNPLMSPETTFQF